MKKTLFKTLSFVLMLCMLITAIPLSASAAATEANCTVKYYTENGTPVGIKEILIDGNTYYDCSGNKSVTIDETYLKNVLNKDVQLDDGTTINILDQWAAIAAAIFENGGAYTCCPDDNGDDYDNLFGKNYTNNSNENCYVGGALANSASQSGGKAGNDYYHSTGLSVTDSLSEVRNIMGSEIANGVNKKNCSGSDILSQGTTSDALPELKKNSTEQTVIYNMVTSVARDGKSSKYRYNSYGLAFYDFSLSVISDENLEYVTDSGSATGNLTVGALDIESMKIKTSYIDSLTNNTGYDATKEFSVGITTSETITTSLQTGTSYSFSESIGLSAEFKGIGAETSFTCAEAFSKVLTNEDCEAHTTSPTSTTTFVVPAYTQAILKQDQGETDYTLSYDVPVALNFKVAVFSMSGDVYADGCLVCTMSTSGYSQRYFYTSFGENNVNAYESLNYRYNNSDTQGVDSINGNTSAFFKRHGGANAEIKKYNINWSNVATTYKNNTGSKISIADFSTKIPMLAIGATSTIQCDIYSTEIAEYQPLYLPTKIVATNLESTDQIIVKGHTYNLNKIALAAKNNKDGLYYGFVYGDGHWEVCEGSENVLMIDEGTNTVRAIGDVGDVGKVQWVLNDDVTYTALNEDGEATYNNVEALTIEFTITKDIIS